MAKPKATHHVVFIVVQVRGPEVADMLRYDNCCPANEEHAHKLSRALGREGGDWVILKRFVALGAPKEPTHERWKSFSIECIPQAFESFYDAEDFLSALVAKKTA